MLIGYARVSTHDQNLDLQKDALSQAGCEKIFTDEISGATSDRPGLKQVMEHLRSGDVLVVWRLDRLGRTLRHLIDTVAGLEAQNIGFRSIQESMDTTTSGGKLIFHVFGAMAEFERNVIKERTKAGLAAARARGRMGGRPKKLTTPKARLLIKLYNDKEIPVKDLLATFGIARATLYKIVNQREVA
jgi:DNA invertase Pin-like site-specific DNA recombinase